MSASTSGGVCSNTSLTVSTIVSTCPDTASRTSASVITTSRGKPVTASRPRATSSLTDSEWVIEASAILASSAVFSPTWTLNWSRMYDIIEELRWSPATRRFRDTTKPFSEITAMSVVPPPMSIIMLPTAFAIGNLAPMAAAIGSSISSTSLAPAFLAASWAALISTFVIPDGTPINILGATKERISLRTFPIK